MIGVLVVEQRVDLGHDLGAGPAPTTFADWRRHLDGLGTTTAEANAEHDFGVAPGQRDVLDEQGRHPLALTV